MTSSRALWLAALLGWAGCGTEIVLGDRDGTLPPLASAGSSSLGPAPTPDAGPIPDPDPGPDPDPQPDPDPPRPVGGLPAPGALLWSASHETGDWSEWAQGGELLGGEYDWGDVAFDVDAGLGRGGSQGLFAFIDTGARSEPSQGVRFYRRAQVGPAFYGAWFKLEETHRVADWWSISLFYGIDAELEDNISLWDVRVVDLADGGMALQFFDLASMTGETASLQGRVRPGEWFEITLYLDYHPPDATRIGVLLNGVELFDIEQLRSPPVDEVFWAIGNGAGHLTPAQSTLYMDDAAIRRPAPAP